MTLPKRRPDLSVVIPVINEGPRLDRLLTQLRQQTGLHLELIVADGGSVDGSIEIAKNHGAKVVRSPLGRAKQMNIGRKSASADTLLFLHADSEVGDDQLLKVALDAYTKAVVETPVPIAGHFALEFLTGDEKTFGYRYLEGKTQLNRKNTTNGDQGLLVRADHFDHVGPFDDRLGFLEDQRFAESFRRIGKWITLPGTIGTSPRRFETEGFGRRYLVMSITMAMFDANLDAFFEVAPAIYPIQEETGRLNPMPYLTAIVKTMRTIGPVESALGWYRAGAFARENSWQLFYLIDVARGIESDHPSVAFHDRYVEPLIDHPIGNVMTAAGAFCLMLGICPAWFLVDNAWHRVKDRANPEVA